jgi:integrase
MSKLKLRKNRDGIKIWCRKCRQHNTGCKHYEHQNYRANYIDPITGKHKSKILVATEYDDAVIEAINFKKGLEEQPNLTPASIVGNDYDLATGILKYQMYLNGDSEYQQYNKNLTPKYIRETIGFLVQFHDSVKENRKIGWIKPTQINRADVSYFFGKMKGKYYPKSVNNIIQALTTFFDFLIDKEDIIMKNYFKECASLPVPKKSIKTIDKEDFEAILKAVDTCNPILVQNNGKKINLYHTWMKDAFRLFLLAGGRREEIIHLKWSDIFTLKNGTKFFMIGNLKATRIQKTDKEYVKYIPIGADLEKVLMDMGMEEKKHSNERIIDPTEEYSTNTMMEKITKAFTHYKKGAGIDGEITLKHLRKTYISWTNQVLGKDTGKITSHAGIKILNDHYLDPTILSAVEKAALDVRIFG